LTRGWSNTCRLQAVFNLSILSSAVFRSIDFHSSIESHFLAGTEIQSVPLEWARCES